MSGHSEQSGFDRHITPHLGSLLEFSLVLTKNGRDATRLLRNALDQTARSWDESVPSKNTVVHLQDILLRQYRVIDSIPELTILWSRGETYDRTKIENTLGASYRKGHARRIASRLVTAIDRPYFLEVLAEIPPLYRPAMFLSFLEGYSSSAIAELAGTEEHEIESTLYRGCRLARSKLPEMLIGNPRREAHARFGNELTGIIPLPGKSIR